MKVSYRYSSLRQCEADAVAVFIPQDAKAFETAVAGVRKALGKRIDALLKLEKFSGKDGEALTVYTEEKAASPRFFLNGVGELKNLTLEKYRRAGSAAVKKAKSARLKHLALFLPEAVELQSEIVHSIEDIAQAIAEGALLGSYKFDKYLTDKKDAALHKISQLTVFSDRKHDEKKMKHLLSETKIICDGVFLARNLANAPASEIYPETLAERALASAEAYGYGVEVWDKERISQEKFGGLIAVNAGSERPPRFIILEHAPEGIEPNRTVVLVGKGITFDSGGISIKPSQGMAEMKMDMAGAAAVVGTLEAAARLKLPIHVIGLIPSTENLPSGSAVKPGDVVTHYGGKTSEVDNTDAEGRLVLADALGYASTFSPEVVIDLATLTGACVVALGQHAAGMMGNDNAVISALKASGDRTHERVWHLPLYEEYEKQIKSDIADVKNVGGRWGGAITAGLFLKKFVGKYKWVHLDIAGPAILEEDFPYAPKGGSGYGVRLLIDFLKNWKAPA